MDAILATAPLRVEIMPQDEEVTIRVWQEELFWKALILVIITIFEISLVIALPYMD